jgi:hypothetical protein
MLMIQIQRGVLHTLTYVLLNLWFSVWCFVDHCLFFTIFVWKLCRLSFFNVSLLGTHLVSANISLFLHLEIDSEGRLKKQLYDKRDDFNFQIDVYTSHWIRYSIVVGSNYVLSDSGLLLRR